MGTCRAKSTEFTYSASCLLQKFVALWILHHCSVLCFTSLTSTFSRTITALLRGLWTTDGVCVCCSVFPSKCAWRNTVVHKNYKDLIFWRSKQRDVYGLGKFFNIFFIGEIFFSTFVGINKLLEVTRKKMCITSYNEIDIRPLCR